MNRYLKEFVELNKDVIKNVYMFVTDESEKICYLFLSGDPPRDTLSLLTKAKRDADEYLDVELIPEYYKDDSEILEGVVGEGVIF